MTPSINPAKVPGVEARAGKFPGPSLIPELNAIQARLGWLPREELVGLSREMRRPLYEIEGLVSFYPHFRTDPPAKVAVHGCHDLTCWLAGADERLAALRARLEGDADVEFREVSCLGRCDTAPAVAVNEHPAPLEDTDALVAAASRKWNGMKQLPSASRCDTRSRSSISPRRDRARTISPCCSPRSAASFGCMYTSASGEIASSA